MDQAAHAWVERWGRLHAEILQLGCFGSYARGDWGVGGDLDGVVFVRRAERPFAERSREGDTSMLPADALVDTQVEWERLRNGGNRVVAQIMRKASGDDAISPAVCPLLSGPLETL